MANLIDVIHVPLMDHSFLEWETPEEFWSDHGIDNPQVKDHLAAVRYNPFTFQYIDCPSADVILEALRGDGLVLSFLEDPGEDLERIAVRSNGLAIYYVEKQTEELCDLAVKNNGMALVFLENPTRENVVDAVLNSPSVLENIKINDESILFELIKVNPKLLPLIDNPSDKLCELAVVQDYTVLSLINNPSDYLCKIAFKEYHRDNPNKGIGLVEGMENLSHDVLEYAVELSPITITLINNPSEELLYKAAKLDINSIRKLDPSMFSPTLKLLLYSNLGYGSSDILIDPQVLDQLLTRGDVMYNDLPTSLRTYEIASKFGDDVLTLDSIII